VAGRAAISDVECRDDDLAEADVYPARLGPSSALEAPPLLEEVLLDHRPDEQGKDPEAR
jgi:hypothetical protein